MLMPTRTISISELAYERLKALKKDKESFSDVILRYFPSRKKLSDVLQEIGADPELAQSIEDVSKAMRQGTLRQVEF